MVYAQHAPSFTSRKWLTEGSKSRNVFLGNHLFTVRKLNGLGPFTRLKSTMLYVKAAVGLSKIHGLGLIARDDITLGVLVWEFRPGFDLVIAPEQFAQLSGAAQQQVRHYGTLREPWGGFLLSADDDRFTNHSDTPNTILDGFRLYAARPIQSGEEITLDYDQLKQFSQIPFPQGRGRSLAWLELLGIALAISALLLLALHS